MKPRTHATGERPPAATPPAAIPPNAAPTRSDAAAAPLSRDPEHLPGPAANFTPVPVRVRHDGWTAERQRQFLTVLSETGSITEACTLAGVSSRSAYRLRARADAVDFARAWDEALRLATARLTALAFERATIGTVREVWKGDQLRGYTREPSERILIFLLQHLLPAGRPGERWSGFEAMAGTARAAFPATLDALTDHPCEMVPIEHRDYLWPVPGNQSEDS